MGYSFQVRDKFSPRGTLAYLIGYPCPKESASISNQVKILVRNEQGQNGKQPLSVTMTASFPTLSCFLYPSHTGFCQCIKLLFPLGILTLTMFWLRARAITRWSIACLNTGKKSLFAPHTSNSWLLHS